ncbi:hypothetical protein L5515_016453 [Caenorhabditis briggsae]|uniref:Uncharacterized protein n=1 Tax=Caenorhabditis briggsae TaxID=6238 RepID=A0AAE9FC61_CAEBR|nr:hypothetical protein L5515_016453 [Caenorhabditis briggsae]
MMWILKKKSSTIDINGRRRRQKGRRDEKIDNSPAARVPLTKARARQIASSAYKQGTSLQERRIIWHRRIRNIDKQTKKNVCIFESCGPTCLLMLQLNKISDFPAKRSRNTITSGKFVYCVESVSSTDSFYYVDYYQSAAWKAGKAPSAVVADCYNEILLSLEIPTKMLPTEFNSKRTELRKGRRHYWNLSSTLRAIFAVDPIWLMLGLMETTFTTLALQCALMRLSRRLSPKTTLTTTNKKDSSHLSERSTENARHMIAGEEGVTSLCVAHTDKFLANASSESSIQKHVDKSSNTHEAPTSRRRTYIYIEFLCFHPEIADLL